MSRLSIRKGVAPPFLAFLLIALAGVSVCAQTITVSPSTGPPTSRVTVHGTGFSPATQIHLAFDKTSWQPALSDASGAFEGNFSVPTSAQPGRHTVGAGVQGVGVLAKTSFLVRTDWPEFGFVPQGVRRNPYENTVNVSSAPALAMRWSFATGNIVNSSPAVANGVVYVG